MGGPHIVGQLLLTPPTSGGTALASFVENADGYLLTTPLTEWFYDHYVDEADRSDARFAPLRASDLSGLPPAILVTAGFDPLRDEGRQYAEALRAAGTPVDAREYGSMIHSFPNFSTLGGGSLIATNDIISTLRTHLSRS